MSSIAILNTSLPVIVGSGGDQLIGLYGNMVSWIHIYNPWGHIGVTAENATHLSCLSNNATIVEVCCNQLGGYPVDNNGTRTANVTGLYNNGTVALTNWCLLPNDNVTITSESEPAWVVAWEQCFNSTVVPSKNPGKYQTNITTSSNVFVCESAVSADLNTWGLPSYTNTTLASTGSGGSVMKIGTNEMSMVFAVLLLSVFALAGQSLV